jgi:hypothetical protein
VAPVALVVVADVFNFVRVEVLDAAASSCAEVDVVEQHALREQLGERLAELHQAQVAHGLGPETGVQQVQHGVLDAADVLVHAGIQ